jgi:cystathionine beta-lyase
MSNFDKHINREDTNCIKYDSLETRFQLSKETKPMWIADMDFAVPKFVLNDLEKVLKNKVLGYPYIDKGVFDSIIFWQKEKYNIEIEKKQIHLMPSVLSSLACCITALSQCDDEVIIQTPVYPPFYDIVTLNNRVLIENKLKKVDDKYEMDFKDLKKKISKKTKLLILCNPHNPIGRAWDKKELIKLSIICKQNNIIIISDEIHSDICFTPFYSMLNIKECENNCVVLNSPTKSFNLAGVKIAYILCKNEYFHTILHSEIKKRYIDELNIFAPVALKSAYSKKGLVYIDQLTKYLEKNCHYSYDYLKKQLPKLSVIQNEATYLIWLDFSKIELSHNQIFAKLTNEAKILLNDGKSFSKKEGRKCFRINVALPFDELKKALKSIVKTFR